MKFESIFKDLIEFRKFPNYQLERRVDIFLLQLLPDIISDHFKDRSNWRLVLPEFPVFLSDKNDAFDQMDYLFWNGETLLFVELKTDSGSYKAEQIKRYKDLTKLDWPSLFSFLLKKSKSKKNWKKFANQIIYINKVHPELSLIESNIHEEMGVRQWKNELKRAPDIKIDYLFVGPKSEKIIQLEKEKKLLTLKKCAKYIRENKLGYEELCALLEECK